jgi:hypothetical protein
MTLDVNEVGADRSNLIELPEPAFRTSLPTEVAEILSKNMIFPDPLKQELLADSGDSLVEALSPHGTIVFIPKCDRLIHKQAKTLTDHATKEMSRIYRRQLGEGVRLYVNNRLVEPFDPTYWMTNARHMKIDGVPPARSRLVESWTDIEIPVEEGSSVTAPVSVRLYRLPMEDWYDVPRKLQANQLQLFDDHLVSFMRNDREVHIGSIQELSGKRHGDAAWLRIQIDFDGRLDEAFGVAMNKQGVRPKKYALHLIREKIRDDVSKVREQTAQFRAEKSSKAKSAALTEAERKAKEADAFQGKPLQAPNPETLEEKQALEANLRALAVGLKRGDENEDEAFERIQKSTYITTFKHDEWWPFYNVDFRHGKVILTINTAHPFFTKLYEPLRRIGPAVDQNGEEISTGDASAPTANGDLVTALQMLLFSLGRAQSLILSSSDADECRNLFENLQREWSQALKVQLTAS